MKKGIVYVLVGPRDILHLKESIRTVRQFKPNIPITIWSDIDFKHEGCEIFRYNRVKYDKREENRNSSLFRLKALIGEYMEYIPENACYLDNDIYITHEGFFSGFNVSCKYGLAMPQNPRMFISTTEGKTGDLDIGADVTNYDKVCCEDLKYFASLNMGVIFYNKLNLKAENFLDTLCEQQKQYHSRGQAGLYRTIAKENYHPYLLPQQYLACRDIEYPLAIHAGNANMLKIYNERYKK